MLLPLSKLEILFVFGPLRSGKLDIEEDQKGGGSLVRLA
jgi:hypothetical protein